MINQVCDLNGASLRKGQTMTRVEGEDLPLVVPTDSGYTDWLDLKRKEK